MAGRWACRALPRGHRGSQLLSRPVRVGPQSRHISVLSAADRDQLVTDLQSTGWSEVAGRDALQKTYTFDSFVDAFGFMTKVAIVAEKVRRLSSIVLRSHPNRCPARPWSLPTDGIGVWLESSDEPPSSKCALH